MMSGLFISYGRECRFRGSKGTEQRHGFVKRGLAVWNVVSKATMIMSVPGGTEASGALCCRFVGRYFYSTTYS